MNGFFGGTPQQQSTPVIGGLDYNTPWAEMNAYGKMSTIGQGVAAFGTLAQLYLGFKAMSAQKKQFNFQKEAWNKNYENSLKDYDNQLKDSWRRHSQGAAFFGNDYQSLDSYMAERSLSANGQPAPLTGGQPLAAPASASPTSSINQPASVQQLRPTAQNMNYGNFEKRRSLGI